MKEAASGFRRLGTASPSIPGAGALAGAAVGGPQVGTLIRQRDIDNAQGPKATTADPASPSMPKGDTGSAGLFFMHRALRWELDNTYEQIGLMEQASEPLIFTEADKANEGSLFYGPDLLDHLKRKVDIMLKHWRDAELGYYRPTLGG